MELSNDYICSESYIISRYVKLFEALTVEVKLELLAKLTESIKKGLKKPIQAKFAKGGFFSAIIRGGFDIWQGKLSSGTIPELIKSIKFSSKKEFKIIEIYILLSLPELIF